MSSLVRVRARTIQIREAGLSALYTPEMLALSAELAGHPWSPDFAYQAESRSSVCGSTIALGLDLSGDGVIDKIGARVSACAVGQSATAILAAGAKGASAEDIAVTLEALRRWLAKEGDLPDWPRRAASAAARDHPGRHGALLLPWEAALKALSSDQ